MVIHVSYAPSSRNQQEGLRARCDVCPSLDDRIMKSQHVDAFVRAMALEENDPEKRQKLMELKLTSNEWERVELFLGLLAVCEHFIYSLLVSPSERQVFSMPIKPSKHFIRIRIGCRHFTLEYPLLRPFINRGPCGPTNQSMHHSPRLS